ncbi:hypothetical protein [Gottfriedia acidiceleris]|uniref:hypothetical protein n=1 Tax=Gottfriedia acidiceleris TaxID=371036 RepID=UPI003000A11C
MTKSIHCDKCLKEIRIREDLVASVVFFTVVPYHEDCYAKDLKGAKTLFLNNQPINGFSGNFITLLALFVIIALFFIKDETMTYVRVISTIPIIYRVYSYIALERYLEK